MKRWQALALVCCVPVVGRAQSTLGFGAHLGYTFSATYESKQGESGNLSGPELGLDIPISPKLAAHGIGSVQMLISSAVFAGYFSGSPVSFPSDQINLTSDGNIYRLTVGPRFSAPGAGPFAQLTAGAVYARSDNANFNSSSAYEMQFVLGWDYASSRSSTFGIALAYHQSNMAQVRGVTIGLNVRF